MRHYKSEKKQSYKETGLKAFIKTFLKDSNSDEKIGRLMLDNSMSKNNLLELFDDGYQDAKNNKSYLDTMFTPKCDDEIDGIEI